MQAVISAIVKSVSSTTPISLQVTCYYLIPVLYFIPLIMKNGFHLYKPNHLSLHFIRGLFSISSVCCFFYAVKYIPLGISTALFNMIPFFVPLIAQILLKERASLRIYLGLSVALPGVLLILNLRFLSFSNFDFVIGLSAAVLMATSMVLLKHLTQVKESTSQIVFNQYSTCSLAALLLLGLEALQNPREFQLIQAHVNAMTFFLLIGLGLLGIGVQFCFSKATQRMAAAQCAPFLYLSVPISSVLGFLIWQQNLTPSTIVGSIFIFIGLCVCSLGRKKSAASWFTLLPNNS